MATPVILIKKVYWNGSLQGYKPMNRYATKVLNLLGRGRSKFTEQNIRDLENLQFVIQTAQEGLYE
tara:strand:+ start:1195 stop:1392 length:198 start_codon:yes stop_codon:yes gene_type:complete